MDMISLILSSSAGRFEGIFEQPSDLRSLLIGNGERLSTIARRS
jgi:hypothetical protein